MAPPVFSSISQGSGHPGGKYLVTIQGTDFQLHPDPPATGPTSGVLEDSMSVTFNGVEATEVRVYSSTLLTCIVPSYDGSVTSLETGVDVDIVLSNLGPPVETETTTDGFNYARSDLTRDGSLQRVTRQLLRKMKREIIANIKIFVSVDYDSDTADSLNVVHLSTVPGIGIFGPTITEDIEHRENVLPSTTSGGTDYTKYDFHYFARMEFTASIVSQGSMKEHLNLVQDFISFFKRNHDLSVLVDAGDSSQGYAVYEMDMSSPPSRGGSPNNSDIILSNATFDIRGVAIGQDSWMPVESGKILDDPADVVITTEQYEV